MASMRTRSRRRAITGIALALGMFVGVTQVGVPATFAATPKSPIRLRPVDGGIGYYGRFVPSLPSDPSFFPIGVWFESVTQQRDIDRDEAAGLNTYVQVTSNSDLSLIRNGGMYAIQSEVPSVGPETVGWLLSDEADMWAGPGWDPWTGSYSWGRACSTGDGGQCGYTVQQSLARARTDNRLLYSNYGKGVTFWERRGEARVFVNRFQDVVSADNYWFTDPDICSPSQGGSWFGGRQLSGTECRRASNYGRTVDRLRGLVSPAGSKPVWAFVELGHPASENTAPSITRPQVNAAVWSSLIHGARGIIYFNHSFGGPCQSQHILREPCYANIRSTVTDLNARITRLAPVLNAPFADGYASTSSPIDVMAKLYGNAYYVFAGARRNAATKAGFELACTGDGTATVLDEGRTIPVTGGRFTDRFADGNAVHIYRIDGNTTCTPRNRGLTE